MADYGILKGKRILVVDDEPEILEIVREQLVDCDVTTARDYESAKEFILKNTFDLVLLDIMGVNGFALLTLAKERKMPAAMLTGHAMTAESVNKSIKLGAVSFLPKEELANIEEHTAEILAGLEERKGHWSKLFERLGPFFKERFGPDWENLEKPRDPPYVY